MGAPWTHHLESFEAINQDEGIRRLVLRMAGLARGGRLDCFIDAVGSDVELDQHTKDTVIELADEAFLLAAEEYLRACRRFH